MPYTYHASAHATAFNFDGQKIPKMVAMPNRLTTLLTFDRPKITQVLHHVGWYIAESGKLNRIDKGKCIFSTKEIWVVFFIIFFPLVLFILPLLTVRSNVKSMELAAAVVRWIVHVFFFFFLVVLWACEPKDDSPRTINIDEEKGTTAIKFKERNLIKKYKFLFYWKWFSAVQPSFATCANYKWSNKWCGELM